MSGRLPSNAPGSVGVPSIYSAVTTLIVTNLPDKVTSNQMAKLFNDFSVKFLELLPGDRPSLAIVKLKSELVPKVFDEFNNKPPLYLKISRSGINDVKDTLEAGSEIQWVEAIYLGISDKDDYEPTMAKLTVEAEDEINDGNDHSLSGCVTFVNKRLSFERKRFRELKYNIETVINVAEDAQLFLSQEKSQRLELRDVIIVEEILGYLKLGHRNLENENLKKVLGMANHVIETSLKEVTSSLEGINTGESDKCIGELEARWFEAREHFSSYRMNSITSGTLEQVLQDCRSWLGDWVATVLAKQAETDNVKKTLTEDFDLYARIFSGSCTGERLQNQGSWRLPWSGLGRLPVRKWFPMGCGIRLSYSSSFPRSRSC